MANKFKIKNIIKRESGKEFEKLTINLLNNLFFLIFIKLFFYLTNSRNFFLLSFRKLIDIFIFSMNDFRNINSEVNKIFF